MARRTATLTRQPEDLISFVQAEHLIRRKFPNVTEEEIAFWIFGGQIAYEEEGLWGVDASISKANTYLVSFFNTLSEAHLYNNRKTYKYSPDENFFRFSLMIRKFSQSDIENFAPKVRLIPYDKVLKMWAPILGEERAKLFITTLVDGEEISCWSHPFRPHERQMQKLFFSLNEVEQIENNNFPSESDRNINIVEEAIVGKSIHNEDVTLGTSSKVSLKNLPKQTYSKFHSAVKANAATRFIESVATEMEKNNEPTTVAAVWAELGKRVGNSIIVEAKPDAYLCNIGKEEEHRITIKSLEGVLYRWKNRQKVSSDNPRIEHT